MVKESSTIKNTLIFLVINTLIIYVYLLYDILIIYNGFKFYANNGV